MNSLVLNLIIRERIKTTEPKARELRPMIEKLVTIAKAGTPAAERTIASRVYGRSREANKLVKIIAPKYSGRAGGYTRILKLGARKSDGAKMAIIEFV